MSSELISRYKEAQKRIVTAEQKAYEVFMLEADLGLFVSLDKE